MTPVKIIHNKDGSTSYEKTDVDHVCIETARLERYDFVLFGDGTEEEGLVFMFKDFMKDHIVVVNDIKEIKGKVTQAIDDSVKTQKLLEKYKSDEEVFEKGKKAIIELEDNKVAKRWTKVKNILVVLSVFIALGMFVLAYLNIMKQGATTETKVDNMGEPVILNKRGETLALPPDVKLHFLYKDYRDSIKQDSIKKAIKDSIK